MVIIIIMVIIVIMIIMKTEHSGLLHALPLTVHLNFLWTRRWDHSKTFLLSSLKVRGDGWWWVAYIILDLIGTKGWGTGLDKWGRS